MCTHSFSTVGGVLLYLLSHLMKRSNCHIWCTCMPFCSWFHSRGGKWADFYGEIWYVPSLLVTGSPMRSLMWRGCAKWTTAECCAVHTENRLLHGFEPENGKSGRAMFRALVWGFQKAITIGDSSKIVGGDVSGRFWILFYSIRDSAWIHAVHLYVLSMIQCGIRCAHTTPITPMRAVFFPGLFKCHSYCVCLYRAATEPSPNKIFAYMFPILHITNKDLAFKPSPVIWKFFTIRWLTNQWHLDKIKCRSLFICVVVLGRSVYEQLYADETGHDVDMFVGREKGFCLFHACFSMCVCGGPFQRLLFSIRPK